MKEHERGGMHQIGLTIVRYEWECLNKACILKTTPKEPTEDHEIYESLALGKISLVSRIHRKGVHSVLMTWKKLVLKTDTKVFKLIEAESRIYASIDFTIIGSYNGLSPVWWQTIIRTYIVLMLIGSLVTKFKEI